MKHSTTSIIPLAMLLLLAAVTFWLSQVIQGRTPRGPLRHDPDYWAEQIVARRFDINGTLQHTLVADKLVHYPDDDTTIITEPHLTYHKLPPIEVFASMGYVGRDGKEIDLVDEVKVIRHGATDDMPPTVLETKALKVFPDEEKGSSKDPVILTRGASVLRGTGFETDNSTGITVVHGRVTGIIHQNRTEKR